MQWSSQFPTTNQYIIYQIGIEESSYDIANNTSTLKTQFWIQRTNTGYTTYGTGTLYCRLRSSTGETSPWYGYSLTPNDKITNSGIYIGLDSWAPRVHADDGTYSVTIDCYISHSRFSSSTHSFTLQCTTVPRASQPSCITYPNNTQNVGDLGSTITIHMNRKSPSFTHTVQYTFGNATGTIATGVTDNCQWTIPLNLANQIPSVLTGYGTITVITYNGSTNIGTKACRFDITVPASIKPSISSASVTIDNSANSVIKSWGLYVVGYSKAKITATASGSYGSTISSFTISGGYSTTQSGSSLSYTGDKLTASGSKTFNVVAKDSRGRLSDSKSAGTITVYAYSSPTISVFSVQRSSSDAKKVVVRANWNFSSINSKNSTTATLYYKLSTSSSWTTYGAISKNTDVTLDGDFAEEHSYNFKLIVKDTVGNSAQNESFISTIDVLLDFKAGGKGLGIGKIAEADAMEVALDAIFMANIYIQDASGNKMTLENYIKSLVT